jgi:stringent starvation protein B
MLRALYEWIVENECTPHIVVDALADDVMVPQQYVNNSGEIVLNIAPGAVQGLSLENEATSFSARFGGVPHDIYVPSDAVLGIYARENGRGMMFEQEPKPEPPKPEGPKPKDSAPKSDESEKKPGLRLVK